MALVQEYSVDIFNSTPDLQDALSSHIVAGGNDWVHDVFGPIFRKHGVDKLLGLALVHHHWDLDDTEFLTDVNGTSTPWKSRTGSLPHVWAFDARNLGLRPLEFAMDDDQSTVKQPPWEAAPMTAFLRDLAGLIIDKKVDGVYGLLRYPGDDFEGRVEMTVGRANINLTPSQAQKTDPAFQSEAAWFFNPEFRQRGCACNCFHHGSAQSSHTHVSTMKG